MKRYRIIAVGIFILLGSAACQAKDGIDPEKRADAANSVVAGAPVSPTATPASTATPDFVPGSIEFQERPITDLSRAVVDYIEGREGEVAVAVLVPSTLGPSESVIYTWRGDERFRLASIMKVPIMLAVMAEAVEAGEDLTDEQLTLMTAMITVSDNDSTDIFWQELGGGRSVENYLHSIGIHEIFGDRTDDWGSSLGTAYEVASLFGLIGFGTGGLLDEEMRLIALGLLQQVHPDQAWAQPRWKTTRGQERSSV